MLATTFTVWTEAGPRIWYQCVHRVLAAHGFTMAQSDNCVFYKSNCVVCVYVDDFLIAAATSHEIEQVQHAWQAEFQLNDLSIPRSFLGIQFDYHSMGPCPFTNTSTTEGALRLWHGDLSAEVYADESQANPESSSRGGTSGRGSKSAFCDRHWIANVSDGWHATGYCVCAGQLSRFTAQPQSHHQVALQRLLRYIKATQSHRITYRSGQLIGYTDADFGGSVVTDGAFSTSGYVFQLAGAPVSWPSKRQGVGATSTTHAEYIRQ